MKPPKYETYDEDGVRYTGPRPQPPTYNRELNNLGIAAGIAVLVLAFCLMMWG